MVSDDFREFGVDLHIVDATACLSEHPVAHPTHPFVPPRVGGVGEDASFVVGLFVEVLQFVAVLRRIGYEAFR